MLDQHRARNNPNKPPSAEQLSAAKHHQLGVDDELDKSGSDNDADNSEESEGEDVPTRKRAARNSKSDGTVKPTTIKYYNGTAWKPALIRAKQAFRRYTMLENLFPLTDTHFADAELILSKTVTHMKKKVVFDLGTSLLPSIYDNQCVHPL